MLMVTRLQAIAAEAMLAGETIVSLNADVSIFTTTKPPYLLLSPPPLSLPNFPFCLCLCLTVTPKFPVLSVLVSHRHSHISRSVCACVSPSLPYLPFCLCLCLTVTPISPVLSELCLLQHISALLFFFSDVSFLVSPLSPSPFLYAPIS